MCIDRTLLRGVTTDLAMVLFNGLGIDGPGGYERCRRLLSEPEDVIEQRNGLENRKKRLLSAQQEIDELSYC